MYNIENILHIYIIITIHTISECNMHMYYMYEFIIYNIQKLYIYIYIEREREKERDIIIKVYWKSFLYIA